MHLFPTLTEALERAVITVPGPVHCTIGPATAWFSGGRVLQIPATGLEDVAGTVRRATVPLIPDAGEAPFIGHLTVGHGRADVGPTRPPWRPCPDWPSRRSSMCGTSCSSPQRCRPVVPTTRRWRSSHFPRERKEAPGDGVARSAGRSPEWHTQQGKSCIGLPTTASDDTSAPVVRSPPA